MYTTTTVTAGGNLDISELTLAEQPQMGKWVTAKVRIKSGKKIGTHQVELEIEVETEVELRAQKNGMLVASLKDKNTEPMH